MALSATGPLSLGDINVELGRTRTASISLDAAENGSYAAINQNSSSRPSSSNPATIGEWHGYNHAAVAPSITITSYSSGNLCFTIAGTAYSPSTLTVKSSTTSATGPWSNSTAGSNSPRGVSIPTVTTWYMIEDALNTSIFSNVYQFVVANDTTPPSVPTGLYCNDGDGEYTTSIFIGWNASTDNKGVAGYNLQRKAGANGTWVTRYSGPNTLYYDTGSYNTLYYFQVRAYDAAGNYSNFSSSASWRTGEIVCFVEGTLITLPDGSQKTIEALEINDLLLSSEIDTLNDTNDVTELYKWSCNYLSENRITAPITNIEPKIAYKTIILNNGLLEATPFHSQLIQREGTWKFIPIGEVVIGDNLYSLSKEIIPVTSVSVNLKERKVYPLTLSPSHTYFANGVLTHNIKPPDPI
ncbi:hypothetical protein [Flavobacterium sp. LHD-85]|uniref:hypothetical protein n=1 Tax=Flavobacterium sp. LHD-85 TaxID=3071410 RepID=UPI0027E0FDBE|nr:hypothetical protein [Flavobacterium sp. LHD-85]MDQ6531284.1 hypothetical protein [Flavobacterium sp. LHD-85]